MTDYALSAATREVMYAAFEAVGIVQDEIFRTQGRFPDGTEWALLEYGQRFDGDEYWIILRWNGEAPTPPLPDGVKIVWNSVENAYEEYPVGLPRFA